MKNNLLETKRKLNQICLICMSLFVLLSFAPFVGWYGDSGRYKFKANAYGYSKAIIFKFAVFKNVLKYNTFSFIALLLAIFCVVIFYMRISKEKLNEKYWSYLPILVLISFGFNNFKQMTKYSYHFGVGFWIEVILLIAVVVLQVYVEKKCENPKKTTSNIKDNFIQRFGNSNYSNGFNNIVGSSVINGNNGAGAFGIENGNDLNTVMGENKMNTGSISDEEIMTVVKRAVCLQLKSPASAQFPTDMLSIVGDDIRGYRVDGFVDSQNGYGAMIRNDYAVEIAVENGLPVVKKATVAEKANIQRAKVFGKNYAILTLFSIIVTGILFLISMMILGM